MLLAPAPCRVALGGMPLPPLAPMLRGVTPAVVNIASKAVVHERDPFFNDPVFGQFYFVVAVGAHSASDRPSTSGIVSALGRSGLGNGYQDFIQTDASINLDNSGGALVNLAG